MKGWVEEEPYEVECQVTEGVPPYLVKNQWTGFSQVLHWNWLFLIAWTEGTPLCMVLWVKWARCTTTTQEEQTPEGSETEKVPQRLNCPLPVQHQTGETPLGWVNRELRAFIRVFLKASVLDKGWTVQWRGSGVWGYQHWHSVHRGIDHTKVQKTWLTTTSSTSPLFILETASSQHGLWNRSTSPLINFWDDYAILNTDAVKLLAFRMQGTPCHCYPTQRRRTLLYKLSWKPKKTPGNGLALASPQIECVKLAGPPSVPLNAIDKTLFLCINVKELLLFVFRCL